MQKKHTMLTDTYQQVLNKAKRYCSSQERAPAEVATYLARYESLPPPQRVHIMQLLIKEGYLSKARYLTAFVQGKFSIKKWGKVKIAHALRNKSIAPADIQQALSAIPTDEYQATLQKLIEKKLIQLRADSSINKQKKVIAYLLQKGYEYEQIMDALQQIEQ
jgi:regulatory protein